MRIGVISDTHGWLDPVVLELFAGADQILHAGDVGEFRVLDALAQLAPLTAVRGNVDRGEWARKLPEEASLELDGVRLLLGHDEGALLRRHSLLQEGISAIVSGHSHRPKMLWREGILHLNPGSAGRGRFGLPRSLAILELEGGDLRPRLVYLED
jgi:putative phosphoesterase